MFAGHAIGCFKCRSEGQPGDPRFDQHCEDQFNHTKLYYQENCFAGRKERVGVFPATQCIKLRIKDRTPFILVHVNGIDPILVHTAQFSTEQNMNY